MNKREKEEMINIIVPLDNLFFMAENIVDYLMKNVVPDSESLEDNIEEYKKALLKNLNAIEETKDILIGNIHLKVASERLRANFNKD